MTFALVEIPFNQLGSSSGPEWEWPPAVLPIRPLILHSRINLDAVRPKSKLIYQIFAGREALSNYKRLRIGSPKPADWHTGSLGSFPIGRRAEKRLISFIDR
jgi:hypothetical protein